MAEHRAGCCLGWPKPCSYHEGWADGADHVAGRVRGDRDTLRAATGGLPSALVAKALAIAAEHRYVELHHAYGLSDDEIAALRAATFEVRA